MTAHWGAGEWLTAIGFALGGIWVVSKLLGALWWLVRAPFARVFYHFVDDRVFAGVNPLDDADDDMSSDEEGEDDRKYAPSGGSERTGAHGSAAFASDGTTRTGAFGSEPQSGFVLSAEELLAVQKMNHYLLTNAQRGQKPSKSGAILAGFGLKRGGGPQYARAALIYDTLFGEPEPAVKYPELSARRRPSVVGH